MGGRAFHATRALLIAAAAVAAGLAPGRAGAETGSLHPGSLNPGSLHIGSLETGSSSFTLQAVFPEEYSVCAGTPPSRPYPAVLEAGTPGPDDVRDDRDLQVEDITGGSFGGGQWDDLHVLRWRSVSARPLSEEIPIEIVDGTVGLTIRAEARTDDWEISVELLGPDGEVLACEACEGAPAVGEVREGRGSTQMPSTDRPGWELTPGVYSFRVRATPADSGNVRGDGTTVSVIATLRTNGEVGFQHRLDLNFVYLPSSTLSAEIARTSPRFAEFLAKVDERLTPSGIRLGRITHTDLHRPDFDIIATWEEAGQMFRTSAWVGRPRALNVYCVQKFEFPLAPAIGLSGGIPGAAANGTRDSGIAIRMEPFFLCSDCLGAYASLMAHEIGHYLGFYHTTESDVAHWDPFLDTPDCHVALNDCPDRSYVMFPLIHTANTDWSPHQCGVALTSPMVRTIPVVVRRDEIAPDRPQLAAAPNPFESAVRLALPGVDASTRAFTIHDVAGRVVKRLVGGTSGAVWDGTDVAGRPAPAGIYFARVVASDGRDTSLRLVKIR